MRHRDQSTPVLALEDWKALREKVRELGGENYEKPVLVKFLDSNTYEVMDRDIVEDEFYVLRRWKIVRELDPEGRDLEDAIREVHKSKPRKGGRGGKSKGGKPSGSKKKRGPRRGRRSGRRGGRGSRKSSGNEPST